MTVHAIAVIPARYASSRLPGKPLADLGGKPMIEHVWTRARASVARDVLVATDDERIRSVVEAFGGRAVMTSPDHSSGTDRVHEAAAGLDCDVVVNIQGDEPLVDPAVIDALIGVFEDAEVDIATVGAPLDDPDAVKVLVDSGGNAADFRRGDLAGAVRHLGLYAYRPAALADFVSLPVSPRERSERLEQLRLLENGRSIRVVRVASASPSVDTPEDLAEVRRILEQSA